MPRKSKKQVTEPTVEESASESSSESEVEDEYGDLITDEVEEGISNVLKAIRTGDKKLFDSNTRFFEDPEKAVEKLEQRQVHKPVYLKDVQRENILSGKVLEEDEEEDERPYAVQQREDKSKLLGEIKSAFSDDDSEEEDELLQKKEKKRDVGADLPKLPDPEVDGEGFLEAYVNGKAWVAKESEPAVQLEEDDEEFEDAAERFENAYNFRYEDPNAANIISYARTQATMRRSQTNSRKKQREKKKEEAVREKQKLDQEVNKKKLKKINAVTDRLDKIKKEVGDDIDPAVVEKVFGKALLDDDFNDADWDSKMSEIFNQQYYENEDTKPTFSDAEPIEDDAEAEEVGEAEPEAETEQPKLSKKKQKKQEKVEAKKSKTELKKIAEKIVEENVEIIRDEVEEERGRSKNELKFRYREVSPDSFGLQVREILMADDAQLNEYIKLKKFAPFKPKEQRMKDKRKYAKKRRLREWRKQVFSDENGPQIGEEGIPIQQEPEKKKRKLT